jgi:hypothetical protein
MVTEMAKALPGVISAARAQALIDGLSKRIVAPLAEQLIRHAHDRLASIATVAPTRFTGATRR